MGRPFVVRVVDTVMDLIPGIMERKHNKGCETTRKYEMAMQERRRRHEKVLEDTNMISFPLTPHPPIAYSAFWTLKALTIAYSVLDLASLAGRDRWPSPLAKSSQDTGS